MFDLLIKGGHVIDRPAGYDGRLDVAIAAGHVAAVDAGIPTESARRTVAAAGQYVTPGLIDLHTHVFRDFTYWGVDADEIGPSTGVTTWVDAGSAGGITLPAFRKFIVRPAAVRILGFLNIAYTGLVAPDFELQVPEFCDVELFERMCTANRDIVVGAKVRMGSPTVGDNGVEPMRQARCAADRCEVPVMLHIADGPPDIDQVVGFLRPGDIITHCFTGATMKLVDDEGRLLDAARRVIDSGVMLDVGHGAGGLSFATADRLVASGLAPHVISTDLHQMSVHGRAVISSDAGASPFIRLRRDGQHSFDLPTCLSKFLCLGMSLADVIAAATARPAELIGREGQLGTLKPGVVADVATFELVPGRFEFADMYGETRTGKQVLRNAHTFIAGREVERRAARTVAPWVDTVEERD